MVLAFLVAWEPTEHSRQMARVVDDTIRRMGLTRKEFAPMARMSERQLSEVLTLKRACNFFRFAEVAGFLRTFVKVLAEQQNCLVFDRAVVSLVVTVSEPAMTGAERMSA